MMDEASEVGDEDELESLEPQVTSSDPDVRKMARTLRIQRRIEAIKKQHEPMGEDEQDVNKTALEAQVMRSAEQLEKLLIEGEELITNVGVGNDAREVKRREREKQRRAELVQRLDEEGAEAARQYEQISERWASLMLHNDPLDVHASIAEQQERCRRLLAQKETLIGELRAQLDRSELELARDQRSQREDLAMLGTRVDRQVELMRSAYRSELRLIEAAVGGERVRLTGDALRRWAGLHAQRDQLEERNMQCKNAQRDEYLVELHANRVSSEELFRDTKIALENENQVLQQELEHLKAFCLLNGEKLDYNYQILRKREDENLIIKSQQKRLINRLRDEINGTRTGTERYRARSDAAVERLQRETHKLRDSVFNVEAKAELLTAANDTKYRQVWRHNEQLARQRLQQILTADRIVSEQLLGVEWSCPGRWWAGAGMHSLPSYRAVGQRSARLTPDEGPVPELPESVQRMILERVSDRAGFIVDARLSRIVQRLRRSQGDMVRVESVFQALGVARLEDMNALMECFAPYLWCAVCDAEEGGAPHSGTDVRTPETDGVSGGTVQELPDIMAAAQQPIAILEQLVAAETQALPASTSTLLAPDEETGGGGSLSGGGTSGASAGTESSRRGDTSTADSDSELVPRGRAPGAARRRFIEGHPVSMEAAYVHKALKQFAYRLAAGRRRSADGGTAVSMGERLSRRRLTASRALSREDVQQFWGQFSGAFPRHRQQLWDGLLHGLQRYHAVLKDRHKINEELQRLRQQNAELSHLMERCTATQGRGEQPRSSHCAFSAARLGH